MLVAAGLAGCGSSSNSNAAATAITRAAYVSSNTSGYRLALTLNESAAALGGSIQGQGAGSFNVSRRSGSMALTLTLPPSLAATIGQLTMREVIIGPEVYVKLPVQLASKLPGGKSWFKVNLDALGQAAGIQSLTSLTGGPASTNPGQFLQYLRAVSASGVNRLGSAVVNGIQTTHYRATIDLTKAPDVVPAADRVAAQQAVAALRKAAGVSRLPVDVWVDSQHLVRRLAFTYHATVSGQAVTSSMRLDFLSYGPQPLPAAPPAGQTRDLSSLLGQVGAGGL